MKISPFTAALLLIAVLAASLAVYARVSAKKDVLAARATRGTIREWTDEQARTRVPNSQLITMPFDGRVEAITLDEGSQVKAGQVVARVVTADLDLDLADATAAVERLQAAIRENDDTTTEETNVKQSEELVLSMNKTVEAAFNRVRSGEAKLDYAAKNLERVRNLQPRGVKSEEELNLSELHQVEADVDYTQDRLVHSSLQSIQAATLLLPIFLRQRIDKKVLTHDVLEKELAQAIVQQKEMQQRHDRGNMKSNSDGVVLRKLESNERQLPGGSLLLEIGRLEDLEVEADILSQDVVKVKENDPVEVYGPAIGPKPIDGIVKRVYPAGFTKVSSLGVEQQRVKVLVSFKDGLLKELLESRGLGVGYQLRVRIYTDRAENTVLIPRSAIHRGATGQWETFKIVNGIVQQTTLEVGLINDDLVQVVSGVEEGEAVVLAPESHLTNGDKVRTNEIETNGNHTYYQ